MDIVFFFYSKDVKITNPLNQKKKKKKNHKTIQLVIIFVVVVVVVNQTLASKFYTRVYV
jgi:hypothetical protein